MTLIFSCIASFECASSSTWMRVYERRSTERERERSQPERVDLALQARKAETEKSIHSRCLIINRFNSNFVFHRMARFFCVPPLCEQLLVVRWIARWTLLPSNPVYHRHYDAAFASPGSAEIGTWLRDLLGPYSIQSNIIGLHRCCRRKVVRRCDPNAQRCSFFECLPPASERVRMKSFIWRNCSGVALEN